MRIWKYSFYVTDELQSHDFPANAQLLHVQMQHSDICLWARIDPNEHTEKRTFRVVGTGHPVESEWTYCGTVWDQPYIWHLFEVAHAR